MTLTITSPVWSDGGFSVTGKTSDEVIVRALQRCVVGFVIPSDIASVKLGNRDHDRTQYFIGLLRARYAAFRCDGK